MKKFLFLLVAILTATAVNAQLVYTKAGKLTFGNVSFPDNSTATAWEGAGHYFHNGASSGGATWLKLDLSKDYPSFYSNNARFVLNNDNSAHQIIFDLSGSTPRVSSNGGTIIFKGRFYQTMMAGNWYTVADANEYSYTTPMENALGLVKSMKPLVYEMNRVSIRRCIRYGFLGQDLETVVPGVVTQDSEGTKYVNYGEIVPILTKAVQELTEIVAQQEQRIRELEGGKTKP